MTLTNALRRLVFTTAGMLLLVPAAAQAGDCCKGMPRVCCPTYVHCQPKPPHLKFKKVCSKPICDPCMLENFGYYPTCWAPSPLANYSHCPVPPPSSFFPPHMGHTLPGVAVESVPVAPTAPPAGLR